MTILGTATLASPLGPLGLYADATGLVAVHFAFAEREHVLPLEGQPAPQHLALQAAARQLEEYFAGTRRTFDLPLAPRGTPFQHRVWAALGALGFGATTSYAELARGIGAPTAARAVGAAVGRNPLAIVVPCHRVVGQSGQLTGYAGGLPRKRWLLAHEAQLPLLLPA